MGDYIRREDAVDAVKHAWAKGIEPSQYIESLEPADVVRVVHGRWIKEYRAKGQVANMCTECGGETGRVSKFCPNCGAKMDREE